MTFISYAQNFEDVMLWRALKEIKNGFYLDIGAAWPEVDSVTKAFYEKGWHGINVEPNPEFIRMLNDDRVRDVNLKCAVSDHCGELAMNFITKTGLSTLVDSIAKMHVEMGFKAEKQSVSVTTLIDLWEDHISSDQEVHFLKIDVEGAEGEVLRGNNWQKNRPWIVVVEATVPLLQEENYEEWEMILCENNYHSAYQDGLNRFYVAKEHAELIPFFRYPPNFFDSFKLASLHKAEEQINQMETSARKAEEQINQMETSARKTEEQEHRLQDELFSIHSSRSWRYTEPLRRMMSYLRCIRKFRCKYKR